MDGILRRLGSVFTLAGLLVALTVGPAGAAQWNTETLDGGSGPPGAGVGQHNAVTLYHGSPHVFSYAASGALRHNWWTGAQWSSETLDGIGAGFGDGRVNTNNVGQFTSVVSYLGQPHVFYYDATAKNLRHAWWGGARWHFEALDGLNVGGGSGRLNADVGQYSSAILYTGQPHVWYYDVANGDLRHAWWTGSGWAFETLDGAGPSGPNVGQYAAVTLYRGQPHVFYYDATNTDLRHAWWNGARWSVETLDGSGSVSPGSTTNNVGQFTSVVSYLGQPHVFYYDATAKNLRHAWWDGARWHFEALDGLNVGGGSGRLNADVGQYSSAILYTGQPHAWYYDVANGDLRHAWWTGSGWAFETLDGAGPSGPNVGKYTSATLYAGQPHAWYYDVTNGALRHAWFG